MVTRVLPLCLAILIGFSANAQEQVPVTIVELAELTMEESPVIQRNQLTIRGARGQYRIQKGVFDYRLFSSATFSQDYQTLFEQDVRRELTNGKLNTQGMVSSVGFIKNFRSGLNANLSANYGNGLDNYPINRFSENVGPNVNDHSFSSSLTLIQPLLKGRGKTVAAALERSAILDLESTKRSVVFSNSAEIYEFAAAYWQYAFAFHSAVVYQENEARVRRVLEITKDLVAGDKKPKGDLAQVRADLANQERLSSVARQSVISARLNLARAIGLSEEESRQIGNPLDDFPTISESGYSSSIDLQVLRALAHENRKDIQANSLTQQANEAQVQMAENEKRPQLDLTGGLNYGGMSLGNGWDQALASLTQNQGKTMGFEVGLSFEFPVNNNRAQGVYIQSLAIQKNQEIVNKNLERNIDLNVSIAVNEIINTVSILKKSEESLTYYQETFKNEQEKFYNGLSTLLNLILLQERLTFAQLEFIRAKRQFAVAIVNLRYQTGTLILSNQVNNSNSMITRDLFYTLPKF